MPPNQEHLMPVHQEKKWWMMRMRTCLQLKWKQMMNQGGTISTAHEHGTQSNSALTHARIPLAQSILEQSEVRQQRNQAGKAHNVEKRASQKEQQK
ncbi:hypothetical protein O181_092989 [Austropuccinia psidii MF-1]|uniref:Uncharacterized protein n=1 Tax=Austropuccinia psidii MF-1 TaxID=1389203 RepID=A0A9Q3J0C2_9BASI|nr:hypothetical protein [Austropuccinia psidii MF-1]